MSKINKSKKQRNAFLIGILAIAIIAVIFITKQAPDNKKAQVNKQSEETDKQTNTETAGGLQILKSELTDQAKFYPVEVNGTKMEVLAFKASDGTVRTALNTCQVCFDSGRGYYIQEGTKLICQNCGNQFEADQVEIVKGGCNPVPVMKENKTEDETTITISEEFLAQNTELFKNWKK